MWRLLLDAFGVTGQVLSRVSQTTLACAISIVPRCEDVTCWQVTGWAFPSKRRYRTCWLGFLCFKVDYTTLHEDLHLQL